MLCGNDGMRLYERGGGKMTERGTWFMTCTTVRAAGRATRTTMMIISIAPNAGRPWKGAMEHEGNFV